MANSFEDQHDTLLDWITEKMDYLKGQSPPAESPDKLDTQIKEQKVCVCVCVFVCVCVCVRIYFHIVHILELTYVHTQVHTNIPTYILCISVLMICTYIYIYTPTQLTTTTRNLLLS